MDSNPQTINCNRCRKSRKCATVSALAALLDRVPLGTPRYHTFVIHSFCSHFLVCSPYIISRVAFVVCPCCGSHALDVLVSALALYLLGLLQHAVGLPSGALSLCLQRFSPATRDGTLLVCWCLYFNVMVCCRHSATDASNA